MTKADIVNEISKNTGIEKVTVQKTVEAFMEVVKDSLTKEKKVNPASVTLKTVDGSIVQGKINLHSYPGAMLRKEQKALQ